MPITAFQRDVCSQLLSMRPHLVNAEAFDKRTITACRAQGYGAQPTERPASSHPCLLLRPLSLRRQSRGEAGVVCSIISLLRPNWLLSADVPLYRCPNCSGPILADKVPLLLKSALPISSGKARRSAPASTHFSSCPTPDGSPAGFVMMGASMRNKCRIGTCCIYQAQDPESMREHAQRVGMPDDYFPGRQNRHHP